MYIEFTCNEKKINIKDVWNSEKEGYSLDFKNNIPTVGDIVEFVDESSESGKKHLYIKRYQIKSRRFQTIRDLDRPVTPYCYTKCILEVEFLGSEEY